MSFFSQLLLILFAGLLVWLLYSRIKKKPEAFSKENWNRSFGTMGILALILIAFVTVCVLLLR